MFYYLFDYLDQLDFPGAGMFQYVMFRSAMAAVFSLLIGIFVGKKIINALQKKQVGEIIRPLNLEGQYSKQGTPTMGNHHHPLHRYLNAPLREAGEYLYNPDVGEYRLAGHLGLRTTISRCSKKTRRG